MWFAKICDVGDIAGVVDICSVVNVCGVVDTHSELDTCSEVDNQRFGITKTLSIEYVKMVCFTNYLT